MARKLSSHEARIFSDAVTADDIAPADPEALLRTLTERRDEALELSPESQMWFGDHFPGPFGFSR